MVHRLRNRNRALESEQTMEKSIIIWGAYPQYCKSEKEAIEWIVLEKEKNRCLCISKHLLDCRPYHEFLEKITWEKSSLRKWLNSTFLLTAFSPKEREKVLLSHVKNPTEDTQDHIFILNHDEVEKYFEFKERGAQTTAYARLQGAWFANEDCEDKNKGTWWLRYYGEEYEEAEGEDEFISCVNFDGYIECAAEEVTGVRCCVRPAFWLKTDC